MTAIKRLTIEHVKALQKAYMLRPEGAYNLSSIALFDGDVSLHDDEVIHRVLQDLEAVGYAQIHDRRTWWAGEPDQSEVTIFRLTPLGLRRAEEALCSKRSFSIGEKVKFVPRSDWIAIVALIVAVLALFKTGS